MSDLSLSKEYLLQDDSIGPILLCYVSNCRKLLRGSSENKDTLKCNFLPLTTERSNSCCRKAKHKFNLCCLPVGKLWSPFPSLSVFSPPPLPSFSKYLLSAFLKAFYSECQEEEEDNPFCSPSIPSQQICLSALLKMQIKR